MKDCLRFVLTIAMLFAFLPALHSQRDADPGSQAATSADVTKPYQPPSASKSVEVGNFYLRKKKYRAALSRFQEANTTDPSFAPAYHGLGKVYEKIGLKQKALDAYHKYLDALPSAKQAEESKIVHKSIDRLERELRKTSQAERVGSIKRQV
jgi:tetratricopeptide (TPR) repeat protein